MDSMMNGMGSMMVGMGLIWLVLLAILVLIGAAAIKYLFFDRRKRGSKDE